MEAVDQMVVVYLFLPLGLLGCSMVQRKMWRAPSVKKSCMTESQAQPAAVQRAHRWECGQQTHWEPQKWQYKCGQGEEYFEDQIRVIH